jgi:hypothetical protein
LPKTTEAIKAFFSRVDALTSKKTYLTPEEERPFDPKQEREHILIQLSMMTEVTEGLLPYLEDRAEEIEDSMSSLLHSHADMCAAQGQKEEVRNLIKQLRNWSKGE